MTARIVGVDVGGTFTDLVAVDADGRIETRKVFSTPGDESRGVIDALTALGHEGEPLRVVHGSTVATNTLLERTGARVVLCATEGATDVLSLRRQERAALYDLTRHHPAPLVGPSETVAVNERIAPDGCLRRLTESAAARAADAVTACRPESVAVALLHSYQDPRHEQLLASALRSRLPGRPVVLSSETLPEIREYERTATTVAEAYLRPRVGAYLERLVQSLDGRASLQVMTSSGGLRDADQAASTAAALALSGPSGGVAGAAYIARAIGIAQALTIDIGGTSADAGIILDGEPLVEAGGEVAGVPIALPRVLVETVSAGGGSIGWVDDGGALRVGPRSAGAWPGPAAFGRGGDDATITDAQIVLGALNAARLSGGVQLDRAAAHAAVGRLAALFGASEERTARAMVAAANAAMARALRRVSVERGIDPRATALIAFGGGGPLHACALAEQLGVRTVIVPPMAGVLSAFGLAVAPERREALSSVMRRASELAAPAVGLLRATAAQHFPSHLEQRAWVRARYAGQGHELDVPLVNGDDGAAIAVRFAAQHNARYGFTLDHDVELVALRAAAIGPAPAARLDAPESTDIVIRGPATVALHDATMLIGEGWMARPLRVGGWQLDHQ